MDLLDNFVLSDTDNIMLLLSILEVSTENKIIEIKIDNELNEIIKDKVDENYYAYILYDAFVLVYNDCMYYKNKLKDFDS